MKQKQAFREFLLLLALSIAACLLACFVSIWLLETTKVLLACVLVTLVGLTLAIALGIQGGGWRVLQVLLPLGLFLGLAATHIPSRTAFAIYRADFDALAQQLQAGQTVATPTRIGPFRIAMAGQRHPGDPVYLATNAEVWEINGFVRDPMGRGFNLWSRIRLDDTWAYVAED